MTCKSGGFHALLPGQVHGLYIVIAHLWVDHMASFLDAEDENTVLMLTDSLAILSLLRLLLDHLQGEGHIPTWRLPCPVP